MLKFVDLNQETPVKRKTDNRKNDFNEIYDQYITDKAKEQSSRCSQCGVPFCQIHCPLQNNIPDWLKLTAEGRLKEAYEISQSTNNMPEVCGRICPQDRLCEGNCVIEQSGHGTVTIGSVEKYITDTAWEKGWVKPIKITKEQKESVGIIGAGPAGLACAEEMRKYGYKVTVYDRYDRPGGLLIYGIPNFKLEKFVVERRTKLLKESGIKFIQNFEVGKDKTLEELKSEHDAILIATGVYKARETEISGSNLENIFPAMDFLTASNRKGLGDKVEIKMRSQLNQLLEKDSYVAPAYLTLMAKENADKKLYCLLYVIQQVQHLPIPLNGDSFRIVLFRRFPLAQEHHKHYAEELLIYLNVMGHLQP